VPAMNSPDISKSPASDVRRIGSPLTCLGARNGQDIRPEGRSPTPEALG
jgi:hypothetical protein